MIPAASAAVPPPPAGRLEAVHPPAVPRPLQARAAKTGFAAVLGFYILFFFRPEDYIPGLSAIPMEKLVGGLAALALAGAVLGGRFRRTREVTLMAALFIFLCLCIPTATWEGNSFALVIDNFSKCIIIVMATLCTVDTAAQCRKIMGIETLAMLFMAAMALGHPRVANRMYGVGVMFSDPNDFALYLCMILPFCVLFLLRARGLKRLFWAGGTGLAILSIVDTFSRGGFLALCATLIALAWRFPGRVRGVIVVGVLAACVAAASLSGSPYMNRLDTIIHPSNDKTESAQARQALFDRSIQITLEHPLLGVGPGDFEIVSGDWHTTHNTFTQLSAEAGIPSLGLLLALLWCGFSNLRAARKAGGGDVGPLAAAVECSLIGYVVGAVFLSTAYWLVPYLLIALSRILVGLGAEGGPGTAVRAAAPPAVRALAPPVGWGEARSC